MSTLAPKAESTMVKLNRNFTTMKMKVHEEMEAFNKILADPPSSDDHRRSLTEE
jgi:hypothetical protein